uniref:Uncharacterized protein n=1 Tax=Ditylenchus dipsaci TaxID=166011 RepID=A0A915DHL6_9BILA
MSAESCPDSPCMSPCYKSFVFDSPSDGCDETKDLPNVSQNNDLNTVQLLQSKINVLNATITHQKIKFDQEYNEIQSQHQNRIDKLQKRAEKAEQAKSSVQPSAELEKLAKENRQLNTTISDLHQLLADQMARSSSENEQLCANIAELERKLHNQLLNPDNKDSMREQVKMAQMAEAKAARTKDLEMECRRLKSLVSQLQIKLAEEEEKQKLLAENFSHLKVQLAACRSENDDMRLSHKASSKQASDTIFNLKQQLSQNTKEQAEQVSKMRQELDEVYQEKLRAAQRKNLNYPKCVKNWTREVKECKKRIEALVNKLVAYRSENEDMKMAYEASSKQDSDIIFNLTQQLSQNSEEQAQQISKMRQELKATYEEKLTRVQEKNRRIGDEIGGRHNKVKQSFVNEPVQNLNPKYFNMCRQSLENMVDSYQQRLIDMEKEYQSLKLDETIKQKEINVLKSNLAVVVEQQLRERQESEAKISAVRVGAKMSAKENYRSTFSSNKKFVTYPKPSRKRKSFYSKETAGKKAK